MTAKRTKKVVPISEPERETVGILNMPIGSIGEVLELPKRYIIRTWDNGPSYVVIWPKENLQSGVTGIEMRTMEYMKNPACSCWKVKLFPKGTTLGITSTS